MQYYRNNKKIIFVKNFKPDTKKLTSDSCSATPSHPKTHEVVLEFFCVVQCYCPISVLTCFSEIFEGLLYKRINNFLNKHNVIINSQYGFQNKVSTNHAFVDVITHS